MSEKRNILCGGGIALCGLVLVGVYVGMNSSPERDRPASDPMKTAPVTDRRELPVPGSPETNPIPEMDDSSMANRSTSGESVAVDDGILEEVPSFRQGRLARALGSGAVSLSVPERMAALETLGVLEDAEMESLYEFLSSENGLGLNREHLLWLKNDLMTLLRRQDLKKDRNVGMLEAVFRDRENSPELRDYALQHLSVVEADGDLDQRIEEIFLESIEEKDHSIAGTALLALGRRFEDGSLGEPPEAATFLAESIATDPAYSESSRTTALQVLSKFNADKGILMAQKILSEDFASPMMLLSSLGVLKNYNQDPMVETLKSLRLHPDQRVRRAAGYFLRPTMRSYFADER